VLAIPYPAGERASAPVTLQEAGPPPMRTEAGEVSCRGSRWGQLLGGGSRITDVVSPPTFTLRDDCIETTRVGFFLLPWTSDVERMPYAKVASYRHVKGAFWDTVVVETTGGAKDLRICGLRKADAKRLVAALACHVSGKG
jgi:hypothetical protein